MKYEQYKPTGIFWLPRIPVGWDCLLLSQTAKEQCEKKPAGEIFTVMSLSYGNVIRKKNIDAGLVPASYDNYQVIHAGNIILRLTDLQNDHTSLRTGLVKETGIITSAYTCLAPVENSAYLQYLLHSYDTRKVFYGMGGGVRQSIGYKDIRSMKVPIPPRAEQDQIVRYLDWQVSKINKLIAAKKRQIGLLNARRQKIITAVVTRGLRQEPLVNSGIRWIGSIPQSWQVTTLRRCASVRSGITLGKAYPTENELVKVPYLRVANVQNGYVDISDLATLYVTREEAEKYQLPTGCVLMTEGGDRDKLGRGCVWGGQVSPCIHQNHIFAVTVNPQTLSNSYLEYLTISDIGRLYFDITAIKTTNLACTNSTKVKAFPIPLPPINDQEEIVSYLRELTLQHSRAVNSIEKQISTLHDLRTRLISDVVTGQIDVRGIEIPDFEIVEESAAGGDEPDEDEVLDEAKEQEE